MNESANGEERKVVKLTPLLFLVLIFLLLSSMQVSADSSLTISDISSNKNEEIIPSQENETLPDPSKEPEEKPDDDLGDITEEEGEEEVVQIADPLYPWNKTMYHFNDKLYFWLMKPVAQGYSAVVPEDIRLSVSNFFDNITTPIRFVSNLLQLKVKDAGNELFRFLYNSTAGVCGLADAAKMDFDIRKKDEDLGQTLGSYGIGHGIYLVWPFLGPSSLRDTVGRVGDRFLTPINYINPTETALGITVYDRVNETSFRIGDYEDLKKSAIDPYVSIRDAYVQHRKKKVED
jgi:phospholipid-binding lipoprotein MlaA